jgi:hypothetical protein
MILAERAIENIRSGVLGEAKATLDSTGPIFGTIMSGLYTQKKEAPLRELGANAYDESNGFDLQLPSILDPRVVIRDFGRGLSHDFMMTDYMKFGFSTKRDSNDKVGTLGYGSKTPLAYTNQYYVRSFQNGEVRTYSISLEKDGIPRNNHLASKATDAPDGLEVSFNVKKEDIEEFRRLAKKVFFAYDPKPNVKNETWEWPKDEVLVQGKDWSLHKTDALSGPMVRMGCVLYPLVISNLQLGYNQDWVQNDILILDVPIGRVDIQHSREQLGYGDSTIAYLKQRLEQVKLELQKHYEVEINKIDHIIKAALFYARHKNTLIDRVTKNMRTWKGEKLPFALDVPFGKFQVTEIYKYRRGRRRYSKTEVKTHPWSATTQLSFEMFEKPITIYIDQGEKNPSKRINYDGDWNGNEKALWIKTTDPQAVLDYFDNPDNVLYLKDLEEPPRAYTARTNPGPGANVEVLNANGRYTDRFTEEIENGWFIDVEGGHPSSDGKFFKQQSDTTVLPVPGGRGNPDQRDLRHLERPSRSGRSSRT